MENSSYNLCEQIMKFFYTLIYWLKALFFLQYFDIGYKFTPNVDECFQLL